MAQQNMCREIPMQACKPCTHALHLDCFSTKNPYIFINSKKKLGPFVLGARKNAMVSDLRFLESNEKDHQRIPCEVL